jgi:type III secretory pathway component EscV
LLIALFVYTNYVIWAEFSNYPGARLVIFNAFMIQDSPTTTTGIAVIPNFPFWLFFIAIAVNMYFIIKLQRKQETKAE